MDRMTSHRRQRRTVLGAIAAGAFGAATGLRAQPAGRNEALLQYQGADREARLADGAKKEGQLVVYTSLAPTESGPLTKAFEGKYGIKTELWRALSDKVVQRTVTEAQARRYTVDVVETNGPELEMITREKLFAPFHSPNIADLPPYALQKQRPWIADRLNFFVVAYNTKQVKREEIPKTYEGFLDPKWKGKIGIEATDSEWMAAIVKEWGEQRGMAFFRKLAEMKPDMRKGHILLAELVASGEVPVGLSAYQANVDSIKKKGGPIDFVAVEPVIARPQGIGIAANAPHPHAALLFVDFVLSPEGQQMFASMGRIPTSQKVKTSMSSVKYHLADPVIVLDESTKWEKVWDELFMHR